MPNLHHAHQVTRLPHSVYSQDYLEPEFQTVDPKQKKISIVTVGPRPLMVTMELMRIKGDKQITKGINRSLTSAYRKNSSI